MTDFVSAFITHIVNNGIMPRSTKDVLPTATFKRIAAQGDKGGKKSLSYWLRLEHDFAYGYAKDFKTGIETKFNTYNQDQNLTKADVTRIKAILKARQAEQDALIAERHAKIAKRAAYMWSIAQSTPQIHPYEAAKGIRATTARQLHGKLFIPLYDPKNGMEMVSWQNIDSDGNKRFPFGGKKHGCCHVIGQINPLEPIIFCEGYATGQTLAQATNNAVVVCFDAGNLLPVVKAFRAIYKTTPFIIAGDNDKSQTGQKAALAVVKAVANTTANICPQAESDFNDIGLEATKAAFNSGGGDSRVDGLQPSIGQTPAVFDWQSELLTDAKGRVLATSIKNLILHVMHHDDFKGVFAYDEFRQSVILRRCPPWLDLDTFKVRQVSDNDITMLSGYLETHGLSPSHEKTFRAVNVVAETNKFHSAKEYLSSLIWDGVPRLETLLVQLGCDKEKPEYLAAVFKKWMTAAAKRIFEPACKFDHVLILESPEQGFYKSTALRELATFNGESYHTDGFNITDIGREYATLKLQGVMIVELSELSGFNKKDDESIKNWITQTVDEVRLPYERTVSKFPRKFVLCATTNAYDYLKDPTGNRRYWPVTICKPIDIELVKSVKEQLWAEAVHLYKQGIYIGLSKEESDMAEYERNKRLQADAWEDIVLGAVERLGLDEFRTSDVLGKMDLKTNDKNEKAIRRISGILKANGYRNEPTWDNVLRKSVRLWSKSQ